MPFPLLKVPSGPENLDLNDILALIGNIINIASLLAGVIAVIYIIIGGYQYVMSFGNPETAARAKQTLMWAIIGLLVALSALVLVTFLWNRLVGGQLPTSP